MGNYVTTSYADPYTLTTSSMVDSSSILAMFFAFLAVYMVFILIIVAYMALVQWKIFVKAGKPGWAALIPVYNSVVYFQICGLNPWLLILFAIPFVNFIAIPVLMIMATINLVKYFGKDVGYVFGMIFLPLIFLSILAFGKAKYTRPEQTTQPVEPNTPIY